MCSEATILEVFNALSPKCMVSIYVAIPLVSQPLWNVLLPLYIWSEHAKQAWLQSPHSWSVFSLFESKVFV